jgi:hypothetical protein
MRPQDSTDISFDLNGLAEIFLRTGLQLVERYLHRNGLLCSALLLSRLRPVLLRRRRHNRR